MDWSGLLKWSLQYTDGTSNSNFRPMGDEDKEFLRKVMEEMVRDDLKILQNCINTLKKTEETAAAAEGGESLDDEKLDSLEQILDIVDKIDLAVDFLKLGGLHSLLPLMANKNAEIRAKTLEVIAVLCQNNPPLQARVYEMDALFALMQLALDDEEKVRPKAVSAISGLIQHNPPAQEQFHEKGGAKLIFDILNKDKGRAKNKIIFLLPQLLSIPHLPASLVEGGVVDRVLKFAAEEEGEESAELREFAIQAVNEMTKVPVLKAALLQLGAREKYTKLRADLEKMKNETNDEDEKATAILQIGLVEAGLESLSQ